MNAEEIRGNPDGRSNFLRQAGAPRTLGGEGRADRETNRAMGQSIHEAGAHIDSFRK